MVGRSAILGKPVAMLLLGRDATVTICHFRTRGLAQLVATANVEQAAAAGQARLLTPVPGGVGPMTIAMLLSQTIDAAERPG